MKTATFEYYPDRHDENLRWERDIRLYRFSEPFAWRLCEDEEFFNTDYTITIAGYAPYYQENFVLALPSNIEGDMLLFATEPSYMLTGTQDVDALLRQMGFEPVYEDVPDPTVFGW